MSRLLPYYKLLEYPILTTLLLAISLTTIPGCKDNSRIPVEGTVSINDSPLEDGYLRIYSNHGPSAGSQIKDGKFQISSEKGVLPGEFRVEITAIRATGRKVRDVGSAKMVDELLQYLPPRYNSDTELKMTVTEEGPNTSSFDLKMP